MSNYEANPVGFLYERYQSSGISPIYEVRLIRGQAHAPIFEAVLRVPEGDSVTATGSSKKIAKNIAAKLMLDKLDKKKADQANEQEEKEEEDQDQDQSDQPAPAAPVQASGDSNNNSSQSCQSGENKIETLSASSAASVGQFYRKLQGSEGPVLGQLLCGDICLKRETGNVDYPRVLQELSQEQKFCVNNLQLESLEDVEQSLVQILNDGTNPAVTVCLGMGSESRQTAARCALLYIKTMAKAGDQQ